MDQEKRKHPVLATLAPKGHSAARKVSGEVTKKREAARRKARKAARKSRKINR